MLLSENVDTLDNLSLPLCGSTTPQQLEMEWKEKKRGVCVCFLEPLISIVTSTFSAFEIPLLNNNFFKRTN